MRDRYDGVKGKESASQKSRQSRLEAEHRANDDFTKKTQAEQAKYAGKNPSLKPGDLEFNATMTNTGEHAQEFARDLTRGLDKTAFPVK